MKKKTYKTPFRKIQHANLKKYTRLTDLAQLHEGMILIDKHANKRTVLRLTEKEIWLSHKYGMKARATGYTHQLETFIEKFPNWIFSE